MNHQALSQSKLVLCSDFQYVHTPDTKRDFLPTIARCLFSCRTIHPQGAGDCMMCYEALQVQRYEVGLLGRN